MTEQDELADNGSWLDSEVEIMGCEDSDVYDEPKKRAVEFPLDGRKAKPKEPPKSTEVKPEPTPEKKPDPEKAVPEKVEPAPEKVA